MAFVVKNLMLLTFLLSVSAFAQGPTFKSGLDAVTVSAVITDERGTPVKDLKQEDFIVQDQGTKQELMMFEDGNAPVDIAIVLDNSASMHALMPLVQTTARLLIEKMRPASGDRGADRAMLVFLGGQKTVVGIRDNKEELISFLNSPEAAAGGETYLFSQVTVALRVLAETKDPENKNRKKIMVIFSDGKDTRGMALRDSLINLAQSSPVTIYTMKTASKSDLQTEKMNTDYQKQLDIQAWNQLAASTGGISYVIPTEEKGQSKKALEKAFADIGDEFGKQYFMGFVPSNPRVGVTSLITVLLNLNRPGLRLNIRARKNYLIPNPRL
jgi:VWFA-related protein